VSAPSSFNPIIRQQIYPAIGDLVHFTTSDKPAAKGRAFNGSQLEFGVVVSHYYDTSFLDSKSTVEVVRVDQKSNGR